MDAIKKNSNTEQYGKYQDQTLLKKGNSVYMIFFIFDILF